MTRYYKLLITDSLGGNVLNIDSYNSPFQITFSTTFTSLNNSEDMSLLDIYNLHIDQSIVKQFLQGKITLIAGTSSSDISELQGINPEYLGPNVILDGYVYDAYFDYTSMPDVKLSIKIRLARDNVLYSKLWKNDPLMQNLDSKRGYKYSYNVGDDIIERTQAMFEGCTMVSYNAGGSFPLHNITYEQVLINYVRDYSFILNPFSNTWLNELDEKLRDITTNVIKDTYPLRIVGTPRGYAIGYSFEDFTEEIWNRFLKSFGRYQTRVGVPNTADFKNATDPYKLRYTENNFLYEQAEMNPLDYTIPANLMLAPPIRVNFNIIQIHTILMPNIKPGDKIILTNSIDRTTGRSGWEFSRGMGATVSAGLQTSTLAYHNSLAGTFSVKKVSHNLNYSGSDPVNWSTVIEMVQNPESETVKPEDMYIDASISN